jgi:hypothetical protein
MLKKLITALFIITTTTASLHAQYGNSPVVQQGEFGLGVGLDSYFGDLNTRADITHPKFTAGAYYLKKFNDYIGLKVAANYAFLGYSDKYSKNETQYRRNLSFNTNIWEFTASGYFNFFKYIPGLEGYNYTPYVSLGVGVFSYDPYAYLDGKKYFLRPLGTEGQGSSVYPNRKPYGTMAMCIPLAAGFKYALNEKINLWTELGYRFTNTDYIDDVSTTYAGDAAFPPQPNGQPSVAYLLQDRSYETGTPIGVKDRQRGNSTQKDAYILFQVGISFNLTSYRCPTP